MPSDRSLKIAREWLDENFDSIVRVDAYVPDSLAALLDNAVQKALLNAKAGETRRLDAERERAASLVDSETCAGPCECFSCDMLNKLAAAIREDADDA